ncbi:PREDICTED: ATP-dependent DNA helicase PIF1-like [Ipomoea nil]|uniref:ATP-dependent DNA helicase PIF1-like n=1 Tax=Ipomoea nil TaxID=35883 RepID=UPI000901B036|nr:PREDICTED: ATP-dependent DNA helicase PIF1-like [Ipomoea nil]
MEPGVDLQLEILQNGLHPSEMEQWVDQMMVMRMLTSHQICCCPLHDHITTIVNSTFLMFKNGGCDHKYLECRAILALTLDVVNSINEYLSHLHVAESKTYFSCNTVCKSNSSDSILADLHTPGFLNWLRASGIPNHALALKVRSPVMLLRNIDHSMGLCNGTRLVITKLSKHVIEAKIVSSNNRGTRVLIPRMSMTPTDIRLPFKFQRRQFPLMLSYAMTINKSQGQTLSHVGLLLKKHFFVHGQLYVATSRVSNPNGLKILIGNEGDMSCTSTTNVVYHEVFNNL